MYSYDAILGTLDPKTFAVFENVANIPTEYGFKLTPPCTNREELRLCRENMNCLNQNCNFAHIRFLEDQEQSTDRPTSWDSDQDLRSKSPSQPIGRHPMSYGSTERVTADYSHHLIAYTTPTSPRSPYSDSPPLSQTSSPPPTRDYMSHNSIGRITSNSSQYLTSYTSSPSSPYSDSPPSSRTPSPPRSPHETMYSKSSQPYYPSKFDSRYAESSYQQSAIDYIYGHHSTLVLNQPQYAY